MKDCVKWRDGHVGVLLNHLDVSDPHVLIFRYQQPTLFVAKFYDFRVFYALHPLTDEVHIYGKVSRKFFHDETRTPEGCCTLGIAEAVV